MPDGLKYLLAAPGRQKFVAFFENETTSLYNTDYVGELVKNFADENKKQLLDSSKKYVLHLILYVIPKETLVYDKDDFTFVYDNFELSIDNLFKELSQNVKKHNSESHQHVLIIDDFSTFSLLSADRDCIKIGNFLKQCCRKFHRAFTFSNQNTLISSEISKLYQVASAVAVLGNNVLSPLPTSIETTQKMTPLVCDLLKIREERRVSHEQTRYQVIGGEIIEIKDDSSGGGGGVFTSNKTQEDVLKNLTTFKLTVEDNEKESRNKLYLPYFDAQKITVDDPENFDDYEDDEDEEV